MRTIHVTLNEKPADLLVHLVDNGPATARELILHFTLERVQESGGLYTGGLDLLRQIGFVTGPANEREQTWNATDDGRRAVEQAREGASA